MKPTHRVSVDDVRSLYESDVVIDTFNRAFSGHWHVAVAPDHTGLGTGERFLCDRIGLRPEHHLLDFGCGVGAPTCRIVKAVGCRARGLNISLKQVAIGNDLAARLGLGDRVQFDLYAGHELPYEANAFDRAVFFESVCQVPHKALLFRELCRILVPGGALGGQDWFVATDRLSDADYHTYIEPIEMAVEVELRTMAEYRDLMMAAGFVDVQTVDARELDPGLARSFADPPDGPVRVLPEDDYGVRLTKGAEALKLAYHAGLFTIGLIHGKTPVRPPEARRACRLLRPDQIDERVFSAGKNLACLEAHRETFGVRERGALTAFRRLVEGSTHCTIEASCKVEGGATHPARWNLFHHGDDAARHEAFLRSVFGFFDEAGRAEGAVVDLDPVQRFVGPGIDFRQIRKVVTGLDLRDEPGASRLKLWFMLGRAPELAERGIALAGGDRGLVEGLRFHDAFLVGFDLCFDGRTRVKLYPDVEPEELRQKEVRSRLLEVLPPPALEAMERCLWTHLYVARHNREIVLQLHPADPDDFVARTLPEAARLSIHAAYEGTDLLDMVVSMPASALSSLPARSYCLYYMPADVPPRSR